MRCPTTGIALERREAPGPTSLGPRARKRQPLVTGDLPWRAPDPGFGSGTGGDPSVAPPGAPSPFWGKEKGKRRAGPGARIQSQGSRNVARAMQGNGGATYDGMKLVRRRARPHLLLLADVFDRLDLADHLLEQPAVLQRDLRQVFVHHDVAGRGIDTDRAARAFEPPPLEGLHRLV